MRKLIFFPVLVLLFLLGFKGAFADVITVDSTVTSDPHFPAITSDAVSTVSGMYDVGSGDYSLLFCATESEFEPQNFFNAPSPDGWTELDNSQCGLSGCVQGIWGKFTETSSNVPTTCSWVIPHFVFAAGTLRYEGVDRNDPVIDIACDSGTDGLATSPSIISEPGSQVIRVATFSSNGNDCPVPNTSNSLNGFDACAFSEIENINISAITSFDMDGGPTGEETLDLPTVDTTWRACTIALRMQNLEQRAIPTMSEWGFIAVAAFMGIAGIWYLRKRQKTTA